MRYPNLSVQSFKYHISYWVGFVLFFSFIWGTYDQDYYRNFMVQIWSLPARLTVVYVSWEVLFARFMGHQSFFKFLIHFFLLLVVVSILIQRPIMIFVVEGVYLPYQSDRFFRITHLTNTIIDVGIAAIVPLSYKFYTVWRESKSEIELLAAQNDRLLKSDQDDFMMIKEGNVNHKLFFAEVIFIESLRNYLRIKTKKDEYKSYGSISAILQEVPQNCFIRVHRSFIVNLDYMQSFSSKFIIVGGIKIPIGRKYREEVEKRLN